MFLKLTSGESLDLAIVCTPRGVQKEVTYWKDGTRVDEHVDGCDESTRYIVAVLDIEFQDELMLRTSHTLFRQLRKAAKSRLFLPIHITPANLPIGKAGRRGFAALME